MRGRSTQPVIKPDLERERLLLLEQRLAELEGIQQAYQDLLAETAARKQAGERLSMQIALLENIHDAIIATDLQQHITFWNHAAEELFGWKAEEVLGQPVAKIVRSEFTQGMRESALRVLNETGDFRVETAVYTKSGRAVVVEGRNIALRDENGNVIGYASANRDVTIRKRSEDALRQSEINLRLAAEAAQVNLDKLAAVISSMVEGVVIADPLGNILTMNPAAMALHGFNDEQELKHSVREMAHLFTTHNPYGELVDPTEWPIVRAAQGDRIANYEMTVTRNDTGVTWTGLYNALPVQDKTGNVIQIVVTIFDITERRRHSQDSLFLARVGDMLVRLSKPAQIVETITTMTGQYLQADHCHIEEVNLETRMVTTYPDYHPGDGSLAGSYPMDTFPPDLQADLLQGKAVTVVDIQSDPRIAEFKLFFESAGVRSFLTIPWMRRNNLAATLSVASSQPRAWLPEDKRLLESVADLTWMAIDRARLQEDLEETRARFHLALSHSPITVYTNDLDLRYTWVYNPQLGFNEEGLLGKTDYDLMPLEEAETLMALKRQVLESGVTQQQEMAFKIQGEVYIFHMTFDPIRSGEQITGVTAAVVNITERRKMEEEIQRSTLQLETQRLILKNREQERIQLAQDLHDGPLQEVIGLGFQLTEALTITEKQQRLEKLDELRVELQAMALELRNFCSDLRPPALAPFGLEKAILSHLGTFQATHPGLHCVPELMPDGQELPEETRLALFRIYQELLTNIVKHSNASTINVRLSIDEAQVELEIQDDGRGFILPENWIELARSGHFGLVGMLERAEALGGRLLIRTAPNEGTLVRAIIPINEPGNTNPNNDSLHEEY